jgi:hypothetical protein
MEFLKRKKKEDNDKEVFPGSVTTKISGRFRDYEIKFERTRHPGPTKKQLKDVGDIIAERVEKRLKETDLDAHSQKTIGNDRGAALIEYDSDANNKDSSR